METLTLITNIMKDGKEYTIEELSVLTGLPVLEIGRCLKTNPLKFPLSIYALNPSSPTRHSTYYKLSHII